VRGWSLRARKISTLRGWVKPVAKLKIGASGAALPVRVLAVRMELRFKSLAIPSPVVLVSLRRGFVSNNDQ
jgi:hypothetical protein